MHQVPMSCEVSDTREVFATRVTSIQNFGVPMDIDLMPLEVVGVGEGLVAHVTDVLGGCWGLWD